MFTDTASENVSTWMVYEEGVAVSQTPTSEPSSQPPASNGHGHNQLAEDLAAFSAPQQQSIQHSRAARHRRIDRRLRSLVQAFGYAFRGLWYLLSTQRNAQIHSLIGACAVALGFAVQIARWEWVLLVLTIALVFSAEALNTAIEAVVDIATSEYHPLAAIAKDVAAGAVLICALAAVVIGCLIFVPHLWPLLLWLRAMLTGLAG